MDSKTYTAMARRLQAERRELIAALQQANGLLSDICRRDRRLAHRRRGRCARRDIHVAAQGRIVTAYYNENDPKAAAWLRELIKTGQIAPGVVDERSITEVKAADLAGFTQCHFFAGIGGWSYALRLAGWPDSQAVWTGSCPCQPFSVANSRRKQSDERHLWPVWQQLIAQCAPAVVFGEQVASPLGLGWLDAVFLDMERADYTCAAADLCAAGVSAPHIRQRLYWVALAGGERRERLRLQLWERGSLTAMPQTGRGGEVGGLADTYDTERRTDTATGNDSGGAHAGWTQGAGDTEGRSGLGNASSAGSGRDAGAVPGAQGSIEGRVRGIAHEESIAAGIDREILGLGDANSAGPQGRGEQGHGPGERITWPAGVAADWVQTGDKWRPVESGTFPLVDGFPERVGLLRGYGNAIVPQVAQAFIESVVECI